VSGTAGLGKTALALEWAHRVAARFPDGQLFLDLRGHDPRRAVSPADALAHLLRSLDVPDERIPGEPDAAAALYRSLVHGRRVLVMADNAGSAAQVIPLVPGAGPAMLLVTSRAGLTELDTRHAVTHVPLGTLGHDESMTLLTQALGAARVTAEPAAAAELARLCGGLPLALRIAAARLGGAPGIRIADLVATSRVDERADGASTVRVVLTSAYLPLREPLARLFRLLGTSPGVTVSASLGAALCGTPDVSAAFGELVAAQLVTAAGHDETVDRVGFHDLVREFARQRAELDEPPELLVSARERLVDWYLHVAATANAVIDPNRDLVTPALRHDAPPVPFGPDRHGALAFLTAERANLVPVVQFAAEHGRPDAAWQLTYLLTSFNDTTGHWHERVELCRAGAAAAAALDDPVATSEMLRALGVAYFMTRRLREALATGERALAAVRATGDLAAEGHVHNNLANVHAELRRFDDAVAAHRLAVRRCAAAGNELGHALSQRNLGHTFVQMGQAEHGLPPLSEALATFRSLGNARLAAATLDTLGEAHLQRGEHGLALSHLDDAIATSREIGDRWLEWETLVNAGRVHHARRDFASAVTHFTQALRVSREVGDGHGEARALELLGRTHLAEGALDDARVRLEQGMVVRSRVPDDYEQANLHRDLAELEERSGDPVLARQHRSRAVELYRAAHAVAEAESLARDAVTESFPAN
jgi:tetratricopeptide (TPR) repeat protein